VEVADLPAALDPAVEVTPRISPTHQPTAVHSIMMNRSTSASPALFLCTSCSGGTTDCEPEAHHAWHHDGKLIQYSCSYYKARKKAVESRALPKYFENAGALLTADDSGDDKDKIKLEGVTKRQELSI
jgi:hypothetical protein